MAPTAPLAGPPGKPARRPRRSSFTKLTVNITPKATAALDEAAVTNGESKTNAVNRSIQAYAFLTRMMADGWELMLRNPKDGREQRVQFL